MDTMWPRTLDMTVDECRVMMRKLELETYSNVISAFRAQGALTQQKLNALTELRGILNIGQDRHRAEIRRATNDEHLATIATRLFGDDAVIAWTREGKRGAPLLYRSKPYTTITITANEAAAFLRRLNKTLPEPRLVKRPSPSAAHVSPSASNVVLADPLKSLPLPLPFNAAEPQFLYRKREEIPAKTPTSSRSKSILKPPQDPPGKRQAKGVAAKRTNFLVPENAAIPYRIEDTQFLHPALADPVPHVSKPKKVASAKHKLSSKGSVPVSASAGAKAKRRAGGGDENMSGGKVQIIDQTNLKAQTARPQSPFGNGSILFNHLQRKIAPKPKGHAFNGALIPANNQLRHAQRPGLNGHAAVQEEEEAKEKSDYDVEIVVEELVEEEVEGVTEVIVEDGPETYLNYSGEIIEEEGEEDVCEVEYVADSQNGTDFEYLLDTSGGSSSGAGNNQMFVEEMDVLRKGNVELMVEGHQQN